MADSLVGLLLSCLELPKAYFGKKIASYNKEIEDITLSTGCPPEHAIGFDLSGEYEEDEVEE